jgi:membrane-bound lytic murein transglycosylase B
VANYFAKHGWKEGQPVATRAHVDGDIDETHINSMKRPKLTVMMLQNQGYTTTSNIDQDLTASPIRLSAKFGQEYWLGFHNFYVIGRYNPRVKYAMAVFQLSQDLRQHHCKQEQDCANSGSSSH